MYEIFVQLCQERGVTAYQVAKEAGVDQATLTRWKAGTVKPRDSTLRKIADFFGVSLARLKGESPAPEEPELTELLEMLRTRSECRMLFSLAKDASPEDVRRAVKIIEALRSAEGKE